jgi:hypothetical protein
VALPRLQGMVAVWALFAYAVVLPLTGSDGVVGSTAPGGVVQSPSRGHGFVSHATPYEQMGVGRMRASSRCLRERQGGDAIWERVKHNAARAVRIQACSQALLLHACSRASSDEPARASRHDHTSEIGRTSEIRARDGELCVSDIELCGRQVSGQRAACNKSSDVTARLDNGEAAADGESDRAASAASTSSSCLQIRALVLMLEEEEDPLQRRSIIKMLQDLAPKDDALVVRALCLRLLRKQEAIPTRHIILGALRKVSGRGNQEVVDALLECAEVDRCFEIRQAAVALLSHVAPLQDERVMTLALQELRKQDLRGEPLFKPYGDPMALTKEAIEIVGKIAPRGSREAWELLVRRVVDDSVLAVRIAAVEALASIADADMLADGGARSTVQALVITMLEEDAEVAAGRGLRNACETTLKALMHPSGPEGPAAGGRYWL